MKIVCIGGGPAGLYFAISMKLRDRDHQITVYERNRADDTFGWGVVFSDQTMDNLRANDPETAATIERELAHWDDIDVVIKGETITSTGHGFFGIGRMRLLEILQQRARELGVELVFETDVGDDLSAFSDADLIIASDGLNSRVRNARKEHFEPDIDVRANKFVWLGTKQKFGAFTFIFESAEHGWIWAHAYRFDRDTSTFIAECSQQTWDAFGFGEMSQDESCRTLERIFAKHLGGNALISNARHIRGSAWINFPRILCKRWHHGKVVLLGDAAHTAHFSIGSGTKLAFEDAIKLAQVLSDDDMPVEQALDQYHEERNLEVLKIQSAARNSTEWFEHLERYLDFEPIQFAYSLLTRSQRVSHENLRLRDPAWVARVEQWFAARSTGDRQAKARPPMFAPFALRDMKLANRVVVSPMAMYSAEDGTPGDFHLMHLGARALGGAGLVYTEMTNVARDARITPGCAGLYKAEHVAAWKRIVDFVHARSDAKICLQLGHAGPKGSTKIGWEGYDVPLDEGNWPLIAASDVKWAPENQTPKPMTRADMDRVRDDFVRAVGMAVEAGFDMMELHAAHGYLLSSFLTPLMNKRTDTYGGSIENRLRYPLELFRAMRAVWPDEKPMSVRISATDWVEGGLSEDDMLAIARGFAQAGADLIDVSAGQTSPDAQPIYGRMFQTPFSDCIRNEAGLATMAVGNIYEIDHVNSILASGRADLCALARPHLADPNWTLRAAAEQGYRGVRTPKPYTAGFAQLERNLARAQDMMVMKA